MGASAMGLLNTDKGIVFNLVLEYVSRQQLVADAISDLRPDRYFIASQPKLDIEIEIAVLMAEKYKTVSQRGVWEKYGTWNYYFHGGGCRLTNTITNECLEWDTPDRQAFDRFWFMNWYKWLTQMNTEKYNLSESTLKEIFESLEEDDLIQAIDLPYRTKLKVVQHKSV
jgi:hypothetical protein